MTVSKGLKDRVKKVIRKHPKTFCGYKTWDECAKDYKTTTKKIINKAYDKLIKQYNVSKKKLGEWAKKGDIIAKVILKPNSRQKTVKVKPVSKMKKKKKIVKKTKKNPDVRFYVSRSSIHDTPPYYQTGKIKKALKSCGVKNIREANQFGWSNQPEVVTFTMYVPSGDLMSDYTILGKSRKIFDGFEDKIDKITGQKYHRIYKHWQYDKKKKRNSPVRNFRRRRRLLSFSKRFPHLKNPHMKRYRNPYGIQEKSKGRMWFEVTTHKGETYLFSGNSAQEAIQRAKEKMPNISVKSVYMKRYRNPYKNPNNNHWKIDNDAGYEIIFDYYGLEKELNDLIAHQMDYYNYDYGEGSGYFWAERWISGQYLKRFIKELEDDGKVGDTITIINQETKETYEDWSEVRRLVR